MNPIFLLLGFVDLISAYMLYSPSTAGSLIIYFAFYSLAKGIFSVMISFGAKYFWDWMGFSDMLLGGCLMLVFMDVTFGWFTLVAILGIVKGIYCMVRTAGKF